MYAGISAFLMPK